MLFKAAFKGYNHWWRYLMGIVAFIGGYFLGNVPLHLALDKGYSGEPEGKAQAMEAFLTNPDFGMFGINPNMGFMLLLSIFVFALLALFAVFKTLHNRRFRSLITANPKINWKKILFAFFLWLGMVMIFQFIMFKQNPGNYSFSFRWENFIPLVLLSIFILPIQTTAEEVFFRGYLFQGLGVLFRNKWVPLLITTLLFCLAHTMNPEIEKYGFGIMLCYYFTVGLMLGIITIMDDGLELALGIHAATNFAGAVFVGYEGAAVQTESLAKTAVIDPQLITVAAVISALIFMVIASKMYNWPSLKTIFEPIVLQESNLS